MKLKFQRGDMQNKLRYELYLHMLSTYLILNLHRPSQNV